MFLTSMTVIGAVWYDSFHMNWFTVRHKHSEFDVYVSDFILMAGVESSDCCCLY